MHPESTRAILTMHLTSIVCACCLFITGAGSVQAVGPNNALNDTGFTLYADDLHNDLVVEPSTHPGQDARVGRDAASRAGALAKSGGGVGAFDFTKIANNGSALPPTGTLGAGATDWGCTFDNVTGLLWEVKVNDPAHLRYVAHSYTWFNSDSTTNGGDPGGANGGTCHSAGRCDTEKFVQDVNSLGLCGHNDWRMPTVNELYSIVYLGVRCCTVSPAPTLDPTYFPEAAMLPQYSLVQFWTASPRKPSGWGSSAWSVDFSYGHTQVWYGAAKTRLVRNGK